MDEELVGVVKCVVCNIIKYPLCVCRSLSLVYKVRIIVQSVAEEAEEQVQYLSAA